MKSAALWAMALVLTVGLVGRAQAQPEVGKAKIINSQGKTVGDISIEHMASATLFLWGHGMSVPYDGQSAWREKFHMDESAVQRLGRAVIRAGVSLPFILLYAFVPRPDSTSMTGPSLCEPQRNSATSSHLMRSRFCRKATSKPLESRRR